MATFERRPYHGSCHCGTFKYIAYLTLPTSPDTDVDYETFKAKSGLNIYKCNCTPCQKFSIFHLRLKSTPEDFLLLSPVDYKSPTSGIKPYLCNDKELGFYFCDSCGVRCFSFRLDGKSEVVDVEVDGKTVKAWRPVDKNAYFSISAATLDVGQEGLDLRQWHEKGWIAYVNWLDDRWDYSAVPHVGGMY